MHRVKQTRDWDPLPNPNRAMLVKAARLYQKIICVCQIGTAWAVCNLLSEG